MLVSKVSSAPLSLGLIILVGVVALSRLDDPDYRGLVAEAPRGYSDEDPPPSPLGLRRHCVHSARV